MFFLTVVSIPVRDVRLASSYSVIRTFREPTNVRWPVGGHKDIYSGDIQPCTTRHQEIFHVLKRKEKKTGR